MHKSIVIVAALAAALLLAVACGSGSDGTPAPQARPASATP